MPSLWIWTQSYSKHRLGLYRFFLPMALENAGFLLFPSHQITFSYFQFPEHSNSLAQFQPPDLPGFNFSSHVHVDIKTQASRSWDSPMRHSTSVRAHYSTWFQSLFLAGKFSISWVHIQMYFSIIIFPNTFCVWIQKVIGWNFTSLKVALLTESITIFPNIQFWHHLGFFIHERWVGTLT